MNLAGKGAMWLIVLAALVPAISACGQASRTVSTDATSTSHAGPRVEGEPVALDGLRIAVASRYLDLKDPEDALYIVGEPPPSAGLRYAAVFIEAQNESGEPRPLPVMSITDARGTPHAAFPATNAYSRRFGELVEPDERQPVLASLDQGRPTKRSIFLFRLAPGTDKRPLTLHIQGSEGGEAKVTLAVS